MKRMAASNVLIVGLQGLGVEIGESLTAQAYLSDMFCSKPKISFSLVSSP